MKPNHPHESPRHREQSAIPELDHHPVDESDNEEPGIMPQKPSSMPRAEDDDETRANSPEYHDRKPPEQALEDKSRKGAHSWE